jgi:hypothetical protein
MTTNQAFGLRGDKPSKLFLFIYWKFQKIFSTLLAGPDIWEMAGGAELSFFLSLEKGL